METKELKQFILKLSFGGIMYDVTVGSEIRKLIDNNKGAARKLADEIEGDLTADGIDQGVKNFINENLAA